MVVSVVFCFSYGGLNYTEIMSWSLGKRTFGADAYLSSGGGGFRVIQRWIRACSEHSKSCRELTQGFE